MAFPLLDFFRKIFAPAPRRKQISPIYKTNTIPGLTADDVYDAIQLAEAGDTTRLMPLYDQMVNENSHLQTEFTKRKLSVLGDRLTVLPATEDPGDVAAAKWVEQALGDCPSLLDAEIALMDSTLYPVSVCQMWHVPGTNGRRYDVCLSRVDPELFDFSKGDFRVFDTANGMRMGSSHPVADGDYVVHRGHLLTSPDCYGGPMRSLMGWHLLANATPEWWGRFLERLGAPFLVGHISNDDDGERDKVEAAFSQALRLFGIVVSEGTRIEMLQAQSSQTGEAHQMLHDKSCREISKLIIGQTSSSDVQSTGSLSNSNEAHSQVRSDFRDWDDFRLCETLLRQVVIPLMRINGVLGRPPLLQHGAPDTKEADLSADILRSLSTAGLELTDDGVGLLSKRIGLPLQRIKAAAPEIPVPFSAERDLAIRRTDLIAGAQARLVSATAPRYARHLAAVDLPEEITGSGASILLEYLETAAIQGN